MGVNLSFFRERLICGNHGKLIPFVPSLEERETDHGKWYVMNRLRERQVRKRDEDVLLEGMWKVWM